MSQSRPDWCESWSGLVCDSVPRNADKPSRFLSAQAVHSALLCLEGIPGLPLVVADGALLCGILSAYATLN